MRREWIHPEALSTFTVTLPWPVLYEPLQDIHALRNQPSSLGVGTVAVINDHTIIKRQLWICNWQCFTEQSSEPTWGPTSPPPHPCQGPHFPPPRLFYPKWLYLLQFLCT